jgi:hypothetical protein
VLLVIGGVHANRGAVRSVVLAVKSRALRGSARIQGESLAIFCSARYLRRVQPDRESAPVFPTPSSGGFADPGSRGAASQPKLGLMVNELGYVNQIPWAMYFRLPQLL